MQEERLISRDYLAIDRTKLANQRTLLAYFRTALLICASGITFIKIFPDEYILRVLGILLIPASFLIFVYGIINYFIFEKRMKTLYKMQ